MVTMKDGASSAKERAWFDGQNLDTNEILEEMVREAVMKKTSDIHLQWYSQGLEVRMRMDGVLYKVGATIEPEDGKRLIATIKLKAELKIDERRVPQDGRILMQVGKRTFDLRINCLPTCMGENIVARILDKNNAPADIGKLGFDSETQSRFERIISQPNGMMIFTGPTGSGKSTTQYAALSKLNGPRINILTAENPVEYQVEGLSQVQIKGGMTFATALRAFLRHDPDVIMIGEMRDLETAEVAIEAALTGHLVFSTLHTNNAPSAITRLVDMGIAAHLIPDTVTGVLAQRLARKICGNCKESYTATAGELAFLGYPQSDPDLKVTLYKGHGCDQCREGFSGRLGIFELMCMDEEIAALVCKGAPLYEVRQTAIKNGMKTLKEDALVKVLAGQTTIEEVQRVIFTAGI